jgi:hypothetical protein
VRGARWILAVVGGTLPARGWSTGDRTMLTGFERRTGAVRWEREWPDGVDQAVGGTDAVYFSVGCTLTSRD